MLPWVYEAGEFLIMTYSHLAIITGVTATDQDGLWLIGLIHASTYCMSVLDAMTLSSANWPHISSSQPNWMIEIVLSDFYSGSPPFVHHYNSNLLLWEVSHCIAWQHLRLHYPTTALFMPAVLIIYKSLQCVLNLPFYEHQKAIGDITLCTSPHFRHRNSVDHYHIFLSISSSQTIWLMEFSLGVFCPHQKKSFISVDPLICKPIPSILPCS
jgi:hypothetical protein